MGELGVGSRRNSIAARSQWFPMLSDSIKADREFLAQIQLARGIVHRRIVERSEHQAFCVVAGGDAHPHPLAHSANFVGELDLNVIASLVFHTTVYRYRIHRGSPLRPTRNAELALDSDYPDPNGLALALWILLPRLLRLFLLFEGLRQRRKLPTDVLEE
jgi:hypothetical protein